MLPSGTPEILVIADQSGPVAMAGIMGGESTSVSETTKDIFLEAAFFTPDLLAGKARSFGLHTDASHRFERGVDFKLQLEAIERASQLLVDIVGGKVGPLTDVSVESDLPARPDVILRAARILKMLGFEMEAAEVERILSGLGLGVTATAEGWVCSVLTQAFCRSAMSFVWGRLRVLVHFKSEWKLNTSKAKQNDSGLKWTFLMRYLLLLRNT
jgi:phenylalanyl-tRNA synthetase beta chain